MDDAQKDHPGAEFASAHQRPSAIHAISANRDVSLPRGSRTVRSNDIRVRMHGLCSLGRKLSGSPVSIALPYAPRDRGIRPCQLLEDLHGFHGREVEPAISCGEKDAKKSRVSLILA